MAKHIGYIWITFIQNDLTVHRKEKFHKTFLKLIPLKVWPMDWMLVYKLTGLRGDMKYTLECK